MVWKSGRSKRILIQGALPVSPEMRLAIQAGLLSPKAGEPILDLERSDAFQSLF